MKSPRCGSNSARSIAPTVRTCRDGCRGLFRINHRTKTLPVMLSLTAVDYYPTMGTLYDNWLSFEEWCQRGGLVRDNFSRTEKWTNLERARYTHWVLRQ